MSADPHARSIHVLELVALRADLITVTSETALPPGSRVRFELLPAEPAERLALAGKIVGLERRDDGTYAVSVRLHSLTRQERVQLVALADRSASSASC
jgi:hypothetical protein